MYVIDRRQTASSLNAPAYYGRGIITCTLWNARNILLLLFCCKSISTHTP